MAGTGLKSTAVSMSTLRDSYGEQLDSPASFNVSWSMAMARLPRDWSEPKTDTNEDTFRREIQELESIRQCPSCDDEYLDVDGVCPECGYGQEL